MNSTGSPIKAQIEYKILCMVHICIYDSTSPTYLNNVLVHIKHEGISGGLRSNKKSHLLVVPYVKYKTFAYHSFSICGPRLWNNLTVELHQEIIMIS